MEARRDPRRDFTRRRNLSLESLGGLLESVNRPCHLVYAKGCRLEPWRPAIDNL